MNRVILFAVVAGLMVGASAFAGGACCGMKKKSADADGASMSCTKGLTDLGLTEEQTAKIAQLEEACKAEGMSKEACAKTKQAMRDVLTPEQQAKWDEMCGDKAKCDSSKSES